jgi:hypothetical protein
MNEEKTGKCLWQVEHITGHLWRSCWSIVSLFRWVSLTIHCIYIMFLFVIVLPVCLVVPVWHRPTFLWGKWNKQFTNQRLYCLKGCSCPSARMSVCLSDSPSPFDIVHFLWVKWNNQCTNQCFYCFKNCLRNLDQDLEKKHIKFKE